MIKAAIATTLISGAFFSAFPASAQSAARENEEARSSSERLRIRAGLGAQVSPRYPGSDDHTIRPLFDLSIARGDEPFDFEASDESFGFSLLKSGAFEAGPAVNIEGSRRRRHVGANIDEVGTTVEVGGFAQVWLAPAFRVRAELRQGIGGHRSLVGSAGADFVARDGDRFVFSAGPRVSFSDRGYQNAYFGVTPRAAAATGMPVYRAGSGIHAVGVTSGVIYALNSRWSLLGYAKYDRLIGDAGRSPMVRRYGARDQLSGGLGLAYTFGGGTRP